MSITTRYAVLNAGDTNIGTMSDRNTVPANTGVFWHCSDASAATDKITDWAVTGDLEHNDPAGLSVIIPATTAAANTVGLVANNVDLSTAAAGTTADLSAASPGSNSFILIGHCIVRTILAVNHLCLGAQAGQRIQHNPTAGFTLVGATTSQAWSTYTAAGGLPSVSAGQEYFYTFIVDVENGQISYYDSVNNATVSAGSTVALTNVGAITLGNSVTFGTAEQNYYGIALINFTDGIPSDLSATLLESIRTDWKAGNKRLPNSWINRV